MECLCRVTIGERRYRSVLIDCCAPPGGGSYLDLSRTQFFVRLSDVGDSRILGGDRTFKHAARKSFFGVVAVQPRNATQLSHSYTYN